MNQYQAKYPNLVGATLTSDPFDGIVLDRENNVKRSGYRSAVDQIAELNRAGMRLMAAREEQYSKPTGLMPRLYGEIDKTVAQEKVDGIKAQVKQRYQDRARKLEEEQAAKAAEEKAAEKPAKPTGTPPEEGGVT